MPAPQNLLIILSDEHNPRMLGAAGHRFIRTPNLDALAARGTRFSAACTPSPICVPARAALATGRPLFEMARYFDNADPYDGQVESWHHRARDAGHTVVSIGKLHFRGAPGDDHGFSHEILPMHVVDGKGDLLALIRDETAPARQGARKLIAQAGPGESDYTRYDRDITAAAQIWLREDAPRQTKPWVLFVSLVTPHFPLTAPPEHFYAYPPDRLPMPKQYSDRPAHPFLSDYAGTVPYDSHFTGEADVKRALAGYCGLVSFMDEQVGKILGCLDACGLSGTTRVLYASDHGDNAGARGLWGKSTMYEESVGVPMILAGHDVPSGRVCATPVSLLDVFPTVLDALGHDATPPSPHGASLFAIAVAPDADRAVLSEYHASGSREAAVMLRIGASLGGARKYVRYVTYPEQFFDLDHDAEELSDAHLDEAERAVLRARLDGLVDVAALDQAVKARQAAILAANGGRAAVLGRGDLPYSPPPGARPAWS